MAELRANHSLRERRSQVGMTLLEVVIALGILLIVSAGLTGVAAVAVISTENEGHLAARTAEYAQDKMEQLLSLNFGDTTSDTISTGCVAYLVTSACTTGAAGLDVGGSTSFTAPSNNYVDYLDATGNPLGGGTTAPAGWFYMRVWQICYLQTTGACTTTVTNLKQITVGATVRNPIGGRGGSPQTFIGSLKSSPF